MSFGSNFLLIAAYAGKDAQDLPSERNYGKESVCSVLNKGSVKHESEFH